MIKSSAVDKGMYLLVKGVPHQVTDREFVNPGKGAAFVRLKLKNVMTGLVVRQVNKSQETVEEVEIDTVLGQYLYADGESYVFMDTDSYEQFAVPTAGLEERRYYLLDGETYQVMMWDERPLDIKLPIKLALEVTDAPHAERGDSVTGATKLATTSTELKVKVPLFIKDGDRIVVNTETGEYVERA